MGSRLRRRDLRRGLWVRRAGQGVVEYGLILAAAAIVSIAGLTAMTRAQEAYWGGATPTFASPMPGIGTFIHPTSVDTPVCTPSPIVLGNVVTCNPPTVHDIFSNSSDRNPPWGYIGLHLDGSPTPVAASAVCHLPPTASGAQTTCTSALTWIPTDPALAGTPHSLSLWYECPPAALPCAYPPESNHVASGSTTLQIVFYPLLQFSPSPSLGMQWCDTFNGHPMSVEIGHPMVCTVRLTRGPGLPAIGKDVTWTADQAVGTGDPFLNCNTFGVASNYPTMIFNNPPDPGCKPAPALTCITDSSGDCSIVYRRLRDPVGNSLSGPVGTHTLTLSALSGAVAAPSPIYFAVIPAFSNHPSNTFVECSGVPGITSGFLPITAPPGRLGIAPGVLFGVTSSITVPSGSATLTCMATVIDTDGSPATHCDPVAVTCGGGSPLEEWLDAHPPLGTLTWDWPGRQPVDVNTCTLNRLDTYTFQPPTSNITPYASRCQLSFTVTGSGSGSLTVSFDGLSTHRPSSDSVPLDLH